MKVLHFHAVAGHPKVAPALSGQAHNALRPFNQYLRQAVRTARERQVRYALPWAPVPDQRTLRLQALDRWLTVRRAPAGVVLTGWPADASPPLDTPLMVVSRSMQIAALGCERVADGLKVILADTLDPGDIVFWGGRQCAFEARPEPQPTAIEISPGRPLPIRVVESDADHWRLLVEWPASAPDAPEWRVDGRARPVEIRPPRDGLTRLFDDGGTSWPVADGSLKVAAPPEQRVLHGDDRIRYRWYEPDRHRGGSGVWVQLLPAEDEAADDYLDPRAAFCEDQVDEVWTAPRHREARRIKVRRVDRDRYQLLVAEAPPPDTRLHLPLDTRNLALQRRALYQLSNAPLPHHQGLMRLCEDPGRCRWPEVRPAPVAEWRVLRDETRDGTARQRAFVQQALGGLARDLAPDAGDVTLLEGPPGSGKTTAICELILQLADRGLRVLLCGSTHAAIDNVLERLTDGGQIDAVRIGRAERIDSRVQAHQLDARVEALTARWRGRPAFAEHGDAALRAMAERTIVMGADLTCGTTMGIVHHPVFRSQTDFKSWQRPICSRPEWDVLIIDEASKTMIQEFLVPALAARRWVIVGDVRQLPPFADRADIVANLRGLVDEKDRPIYPPEHQRARFLLWQLGRPALRRTGARLLIAEPSAVLDRLEAEMDPEDPPDAVRIVARRRRGGPRGPVHHLPVAALERGSAEALRLAGAQWVLVDPELLPAVERWLPGDLLDLGAADGLPPHAGWRFRRAHRARTAPRPLQPLRARGRTLETFAAIEAHEAAEARQRDWAGEVTWRLTRTHELKRSQRQDIRERYRRDIDRLCPRTVDVGDAIAEIRDIGLPSILEVIQEGIGEGRSKRPSTLTEGMPGQNRAAFEQRFTSLDWQHRMHPTISAFPRAHVYSGEALKDANTIADRDAALGWDFAPELPARRVWLDVRGQVARGANAAEVEAMARGARAFLRWAGRRGPRDAAGRPWEVACLAFYVKQEAAIRAMLQQLTGDDRNTRFSKGPVEFVCGTVDRFQGREADLVFLSMRNVRRIGFLDSVNRLNVAVTRARQQLVVIGHNPYFAACRVAELEALARDSRRVDGRRAFPSPREGE